MPVCLQSLKCEDRSLQIYAVFQGTIFLLPYMYQPFQASSLLEKGTVDKQSNTANEMYLNMAMKGLWHHIYGSI